MNKILTTAKIMAARLVLQWENKQIKPSSIKLQPLYDDNGKLYGYRLTRSAYNCTIFLEQIEKELQAEEQN